MAYYKADPDNPYLRRHLGTEVVIDTSPFHDLEPERCIHCYRSVDGILDSELVQLSDGKVIGFHTYNCKRK